ncbi:NAD-dependent epimerase/dehydratase family protein [Nocardioides sp.]|uniref:NAD-dependent epimerase/dehydratase family protein n=1 Tax=Nocardioides sp. TaxID=35761 RepID=UPI002ED42C9C
MTRVLVTGAAGFIGSHLCEALVQDGCEVRGVDAFTEFYDPASKRRNIAELMPDPAFELVEADVRTAPSGQLLDGIDAVAHLAGEPGVSTSWGPSFERYVDRNVLATQRLLEAALAKGVSRFVYASSSSVYGAETEALRARGEPRPASPYGVSKLAAEALVGAYAYSYGLPGVSLRYFSVYGPRQRPDMAAHRFIEALLDGRPLQLFGDGSQTRDFTFVGDVVRATSRALFADLPPAAVLDIACGRPTSVATLIEELRSIVDVDDPSLETRQERPGDVPRTAGRIDAARQHLDWSPTVGLRAGLRQQVAWHAGVRDSQPISGLAGGATDPHQAVRR